MGRPTAHVHGDVRPSRPIAVLAPPEGRLRPDRHRAVPPALTPGHAPTCRRAASSIIGCTCGKAREAQGSMRGWIGARTHRAAGWVDGALVGRSGHSADGQREAATRVRRARGGGRGAVIHWPAGSCTRHARGWGWQVTKAGLEQAGPYGPCEPGDPTCGQSRQRNTGSQRGEVGRPCASLSPSTYGNATV